MPIPSAPASLPAIAAPIQRGIERETLRTTPDGHLALTPHPRALGSKLAHPHITTDFSEAQLELITGVAASTADLLDELGAIHSRTYAGIEDELLWPASMPCELPRADAAIPLAQYGTSNAALTKTTYRNGLGLRYGRAMQTICAVHYNVSFSERLFDTLAAAEGAVNDQRWRDVKYFNLMRNFRANSWLVVYLFGASPAVSDSFVTGRTHTFERLGPGTLHMPYATSLRSGALGYQSDVQAQHLLVTYNSLDNYVGSLARAITTPYSGYEGEGAGKPAQLNKCILQSEAEFYSSIRAKRVAEGHHSGLAALAGKGVEYIEVRLLDIDPLAPLGVAEETLNFMDAFLTWCLTSPAGEHNAAKCTEIVGNIRTTVHRGREPGLMLQEDGNPRTLQAWGAALLDAIEPAGNWLDACHGGSRHQNSLEAQRRKIEDPRATPSAAVEDALATAGESFNAFGLKLARAHRDVLVTPLDSSQQNRFEAMERDSIAAQAAGDNADGSPFAAHLEELQQGYVALVTPANQVTP